MDLAHDEPNYMLIFYWLAALTALEVGVTYMGLPKMLMIAILVGLAVAKAAMVAMYFMHLKFERRTLGLIALTPPLLLVNVRLHHLSGHRVEALHASLSTACRKYGDVRQTSDSLTRPLPGGLSINRVE